MDYQNLIKKAFIMEYCNFHKIILFQLLNSSFSQKVEDFNLKNMYVQHLQVIIKKNGHLHGLSGLF